jgi:beta-lactamase regulating signal transducer with metallopeptidase domain
MRRSCNVSNGYRSRVKECSIDCSEVALHHSSMSLLVELSMYLSTAIVVVALLRKVLRRVVGAQLAYWLWSLVPACAAVVALPPPARLSGLGGESFSQSLVSILPSMELGSIASATTDYATVGVVVWVSVGLIMLGFMVRRQRAFVDSLGTLVLTPDGRSTQVRPGTRM